MEVFIATKLKITDYFKEFIRKVKEEAKRTLQGKKKKSFRQKDEDGLVQGSKIKIEGKREIQDIFSEGKKKTDMWIGSGK